MPLLMKDLASHLLFSSINSLVMYPWRVKASELDGRLKNRAYVDDLTAWTKGENRVEVTQGLVELTDKFGEL